MTTATIEINDQGLKDLLNRLSARIGDMTPVMREVATDVRLSVIQNFLSQGRPVRWVQSLRARRDGGYTLIDTGRLINSFRISSGPSEAVVFTAVPYATTHHFGAKKGAFGVFTTRSGKNMPVPFGQIPERPFMMLQDDDKGVIMQKLVKRLENG